MRRFGVIAVATVLFAAGAHAQGNPDINGPRTDTEQGASGYIKGNRSGETIGGIGLSREQDIRRTSSGQIALSQGAHAALRSAAESGELHRTDGVAFTVAVGAAVPQQAGARDLPPALHNDVPSGNQLSYVLVSDRLILVDKRTERIVAIVPGMG